MAIVSIANSIILTISFTVVGMAILRFTLTVS